MQKDLIGQKLHGVCESGVLPLHAKHDGLHEEHQGNPSTKVESEDDETRAIWAERYA